MTKVFVLVSALFVLQGCAVAQTAVSAGNLAVGAASLAL